VDIIVRNYARHHPRKRVIQYAGTFLFKHGAVITGYPLELVIGLANGETRWRV
jgi:hypothetical protein